MGSGDFISSIVAGFAPTNLLGAYAPLAPLIIAVTIFALVRKTLNKNTHNISNGRGASV